MLLYFLRPTIPLYYSRTVYVKLREFLVYAARQIEVFELLPGVADQILRPKDEVSRQEGARIDL